MLLAMQPIVLPQPTTPAAARFANVAKRIPKMIGAGRRKRAVSVNNRICVFVADLREADNRS
jgi:hypothetical protein